MGSVPSPRWRRLGGRALLTSRLISFQRRLGLNMNLRMSFSKLSCISNCGVPLLLDHPGQ